MPDLATCTSGEANPVTTVEATTTPQKLKGVHGGKLDKENGGDPPQ